MTFLVTLTMIATMVGNADRLATATVHTVHAVKYVSKRVGHQTVKVSKRIAHTVAESVR